MSFIIKPQQMAKNGCKTTKHVVSNKI